MPVQSGKTAQELGLKRTSWIPEYWNETQVEVWKCLDEHWDLLITKNVGEFIKYIQSPTTPFVLLGNAKPVVKPGDAMPAGEIWLRVIPEFVVGLPR